MRQKYHAFQELVYEQFHENTTAGQTDGKASSPFLHTSVWIMKK